MPRLTNEAKKGGQKRTRNTQICFRLTEREREKLQRKAEKAGMKMTTYICHLINNRIPVEKPPQEYYEYLKELRAIGRNINQIATVANATGIIDEDRYKSQYLLLQDNMMRLINATEMPKEVT